MDREVLLTTQIQDAQCHVARLHKLGFPVEAACWAKRDDSGFWYLHLIGGFTQSGALGPIVDATYRATSDFGIESLAPDQVRFDSSEGGAEVIRRLRRLHPRPLIHVRNEPLG